MNLVLNAFLAIATKLLTSEFIQFLMIKGAEALAKKTDNKFDDEIVEKVKEILGR